MIAFRDSLVEAIKLRDHLAAEFDETFEVVVDDIGNTGYTTIDLVSQKRDKKVDGGESLNTPEGKKYDSNKSMVGTLCNVFPNALLAIGNCIEFGTHKYPDPANWQKVEGAFTRYQDSIMRHYLKFLAGQERDTETDLLHLAHMAWNVLAVLELYLREHMEEFEQELYK